jgi:hypothetical protein
MTLEFIIHTLLRVLGAQKEDIAKVLACALGVPEHVKKVMDFIAAQEARLMRIENQNALIIQILTRDRKDAGNATANTIRDALAIAAPAVANGDARPI